MEYRLGVMFIHFTRLSTRSQGKAHFCHLPGSERAPLARIDRLGPRQGAEHVVPQRTAHPITRVFVSEMVPQVMAFESPRQAIAHRKMMNGEVHRIIKDIAQGKSDKNRRVIALE